MGGVHTELCMSLMKKPETESSVGCIVAELLPEVVSALQAGFGDFLLHIKNCCFPTNAA